MLLSHREQSGCYEKGRSLSRGRIRQLKEDLTKVKEELDSTKKTMNQYLQNVAHQLTAPLNAIKWGIEAIKDEKVTISRKLKLLSWIYSQGTILDYSRLFTSTQAPLALRRYTFIGL
jgi:signal transduction histidine kinase